MKGENTGKRIRIVVLFIPLLMGPVVEAQESSTPLSAVALQGEGGFAICQSCHDASLNPPKAPPMFGVQKFYKRQYESKDEFVNAIVAFVEHPSDSSALMKMPVSKLGLMPALPLGSDTLTPIATYIYEAQFEPPCDHWANVLGSGDDHGGKGHRRQAQSKYDKFCK